MKRAAAKCLLAMRDFLVIRDVFSSDLCDGRSFSSRLPFARKGFQFKSPSEKGLVMFICDTSRKGSGIVVWKRFFAWSGPDHEMHSDICSDILSDVFKADIFSDIWIHLTSCFSSFLLFDLTYLTCFSHLASSAKFSAQQTWGKPGGGDLQGGGCERPGEISSLVTLAAWPPNAWKGHLWKSRQHKTRSKSQT